MKISSIPDTLENLKICNAWNTDNWDQHNPIQDLYTLSMNDTNAAIVGLIVLKKKIESVKHNN